MTHEVIRHLLDDYVTGDLTEDARGPVTDHVAACEICAAEVESLKRILARATDLPKSIEPPAQAWSNISASRGRASPLSTSRRKRPRRWSRKSARAAIRRRSSLRAICGMLLHCRLP